MSALQCLSCRSAWPTASALAGSQRARSDPHQSDWRRAHAATYKPPPRRPMSHIGGHLPLARRLCEASPFHAVMRDCASELRASAVSAGPSRPPRVDPKLKLAGTEGIARPLRLCPAQLAHVCWHQLALLLRLGGLCAAGVCPPTNSATAQSDPPDVLKSI